MNATPFADSEEIYAWLLGFVNVEKGQATVFKLDRMRALAEALGSPHLAYRTVHVAGSKGKGSVSAMLARIFAAAGRKTGLYTSPHLLRWKERISLAGEEMAEEPLLRAAESVRALVEGRGPEDFPGGELPTYFELCTLVAFEAFRIAGCDLVVVETGLGGRLDSTNIVDSALSVITALELEHTEWLGDTIEKIAFEKAGIIKPGRPLCLAPQTPAAREVVLRVAAEKASPVYEAGELLRVEGHELGPGGTKARISFGPGLPWSGSEDFLCPLLGEVQARNMAQALLAAVLVEPGLDLETARRGLASVRLPARFEIVSTDPPIVLDGAHTPASVALSLGSFEALFPGPRLLLFACALDKHHREMAEILAPRFGAVVVTKPGSFKQSDPRAVFESFRAQGGEVELIEEPRPAFARCRERARREGLALLVVGSFYLCAEAAAVLGEGGA